MKSILAWFVVQHQNFQAFLASHPIIKTLADGAVKASLVAACTYIMGALNQDHAQAFTMAGLGATVLLALKLYAQHAFDSSVLADMTQTPVAQLAAKRAASPTVAGAPSNSGGGGMKSLILLIGFLMFGLVGQVSAGFLMPGGKVISGNDTLSLPAGTALYLMPIEGFQVGSNLPSPTYGVSLNEDLVLGDMTSVNGIPNLSPILGLGASLYLDGAGVVNGNGPLILMAGVNAIGPDLDLLGLGNGQGLVPNILYTYDFVSKTWKCTGGLTVFLDLGPGTAKKL